MAAFVLGIGVAYAAPTQADPRNDSTTALVQGQYKAVIESADAGLAKSPRDPLLHYNKGSALAALGQYEAAIAELRMAERLFVDLHWRGLAVYRMAVAQEDAKRCPDAQREFAAYSKLVGQTEPDSVEIAQRASESCGVAPPERQQVSGKEKQK